jgi:hypothetical protein
MTRDDIIRLACGYTPFENRWYESIEVGDFIAEKSSGDVAIVLGVLRQRPHAPDYFRLDFADGSRVDHTDNHLSANYRPYVLPSKIAAAEREACAKLCEDIARHNEEAGCDIDLLIGNMECAAAIRARGEA